MKKAIEISINFRVNFLPIHKHSRSRPDDDDEQIDIAEKSQAKPVHIKMPFIAFRVKLLIIGCDFLLLS